MKHVLIAAALLSATPALAEEERGRDLMAEAFQLFMRGFMAEMEPALDDLSKLVQDLNGYHPPEILPNGDIIIRRKTERDLEEGEVEL